MADWNKPSSTDAYNNVGGVLDSLAQKDLDAARAFDDASTAPTNTPTGAMRLSTNERKFKWWDGSAWIEKITEFAINISGYAAKLQTARKINVTGALTSTGANFDGTADINIDVTDVDLDKVGKAGTAAKANVGTGAGQLVPAERVVFGEAGYASTDLDPGGAGVSPDAVTKSGFYRATVNFSYLIHANHPAGPADAFQFGTQVTNPGSFYARTKINSVWGPLVKFWTTGNFDPALKADKTALGTAAAADLNLSRYDAYSNRVVRTGDFGVGAGMVTRTNMANSEGFGIYYDSSVTAAFVLNMPYTGNIVGFRLANVPYQSEFYLYAGNGAGAFQTGVRIWHSGNYNPVYHGASVVWYSSNWYVAVEASAAYEAPQNYVVSGIVKGVSGNTNGDVIAGVYIRSLMVA